MYILNIHLPVYAVLYEIFILHLHGIVTKYPPLCLRYGQRQYTKQAALTESDFHGDETKPETIGALFKPLYRENMLRVVN